MPHTFLQSKKLNIYILITHSFMKEIKIHHFVSFISLSFLHHNSSFFFFHYLIDKILSFTQKKRIKISFISWSQIPTGKKINLLHFSFSKKKKQKNTNDCLTYFKTWKLFNFNIIMDMNIQKSWTNLNYHHKLFQMNILNPTQNPLASISWRADPSIFFSTTSTTPFRIPISRSCSIVNPVPSKTFPFRMIKSKGWFELFFFRFSRFITSAFRFSLRRKSSILPSNFDEKRK